MGKQYHRSISNFPGTLSLDIVEDFGIILQALKLYNANNDFIDVLAKRIDIRSLFRVLKVEELHLLNHQMDMAS